MTSFYEYLGIMEPKRSQEQINTDEASWQTLMMCRLFGTQTHTDWSKPYHSSIKIWRGKSYYIEGKSDHGKCLLFLMVSLIATVCFMYSVLLFLFIVAVLFVLWDNFVAPIKAEDRKMHSDSYKHLNTSRYSRQS